MRLTPSLIEQIVTESEAAFSDRLAAAQQREAKAYSRYHGIFPRWPAREGSPQMVGLGTQIGGFVGQAEWLHAAAAAKQLLAIRRGNWSRGGDASVARYVLSYGFGVADRCPAGSHAIEVVTHGVDVSDCPNPTAAIARVRATVAA